MTTEYGNILLEPFKVTSKNDDDAYFVCHFSKIEDKFAGSHDGIDAVDAMIIIKQLVKDFKIDSTLLSTVL
jgi:hypothetical protein